MKYLIAIAVLTAFTQFVLVPSLDTGAVANQIQKHNQAIEDAAK